MNLFKRIQSFDKKDRTYIILGIILAVVCFIPVIADLLSKKNYYGYFEKKMIEIDELEECTEIYAPISDEDIKQTFMCVFDTVSEICLWPYTGENDESTDYHIVLRVVETGTVVDEWDITASSIRQSEPIFLKCSAPVNHFDLRGKMLCIEISGDNSISMGNSGFYGLSIDGYKDGSIFIGDKAGVGDLVMTVMGYDGIESFGRVKIWLSVYILIIVEALLFYTRRRSVAKI